MSARTPSKRFFGLVSCVSIAGAVATFSPGAQAACPELDPGPIPYQNAKSSPACSDADLAAFEAAAKQQGATFKDVEAAVAEKSATCAACLFTKEDDPSWGPIVYVGDQGGAFVNWGACFEKAPGGSAACGEAVQKGEMCITARCEEHPEVCTSKAASDACAKEVLQDPASCGKYDPFAACPDFQKAFAACGDIFKVAAYACGMTPPPDPDPDPDPGDDDEDDDDDGSSSSSGGSKKKKPSTSSSGGEATPTETTTTTSSCAQGTGSGGSIASALILGAAVIGAVSRRRKQQ